VSQRLNRLAMSCIAFVGRDIYMADQSHFRSIRNVLGVEQGTMTA